jgi:hypothetical protein
MELTHRLTYNGTTTVIDEPIGFDNLQSTIKRHDYHGMGAEVSLGNLEFYGAAFDIIAGAYAADIDSEVLYEVLAGTDIIYSGKLDLSTYSVKQGDYRSVSVKVGEIGAKTTFNNRIDKEVDVDNPNTIDGAAVSAPTWLELHVPMKHLLYTDSIKQKEAKVVPCGTNTSTPETTDFVLDDPEAQEFGKFCEDETLFIKTEDFDETFGIGTDTKIEVNVSAEITRFYIISTGGWQTPPIMQLRLYSGNTVIASESFPTVIGDNTGKTATLTYSGTRETGTLNLGVYIYKGDANPDIISSDIQVTIAKDSTVKLTMYDNLAEDVTKAKMLLIHDALNVISQAISENALSVKSDWYRTPESHWNPGAIRTKANGGNGALKAITNGYHIRGLFTEGETQRNMPLSFKDLIESLDAMDCIGWGFSTEDNVLCLRVERWDWFYKDTVILTLDNVAEVTTEVYPDLIQTELKIGYNKFATQDQYNSIDSPHGTRTFVNGIKALSKSITKESEFIADNYAIEETRRARTQVNETEETTYDENIFVFELTRTEPIVPAGGTPIPPSYIIAHSAINATNVGRAEEFINAKLTPRHMAARWRDFLFATNNSTDFRFISGEINYKSSFETHPEADMKIIVGASYLDSFAVKSPQNENDDISYIHAKFKAEKITFSYPISIEDYKTIKANPYGLVSVNGTLGWIMDFKYSLQDGMADFTLIAKYTN